MLHWYCIRTRRYKERWVAQQIEQRRIDVYLPLLRRRQTVRRKRHWVVEPLFPNYLFARYSLDEQYHAVRFTPGVIDVLRSADDGPHQVDDSLIELLRTRSANGFIQVQPARLAPGELLEVIDGPFRSLQVLFAGELKGGERIAVLLDFLSSQVRVELPRDYVRKPSAGFAHYAA